MTLDDYYCAEGYFLCREKGNMYHHEENNGICIENKFKELYEVTGVSSNSTCHPKKTPVNKECTKTWRLCGETCIPNNATCNENHGMNFTVNTL